MPEIHERLQNVSVENLDALECIKKYAHSNSLVYCDPPYVWSTRTERVAYGHECTDEYHEQLVTTLLAAPGHRILSGYESAIYQPLLDAGWKREEKQYTCSMAPGKNNRIECLYCSPINP